jgi:hypothetical protein
MANENQTRDTVNKNTHVVTLFNLNSGCLQLGFFDKNPSIKISPVFSKYLGAEIIEKGEKPYNHDAAVFFPISLADIVLLEIGLRQLEEKMAEGECLSFTIYHKGPKSEKYLTVGTDAENFYAYIKLSEVDVEKEAIINEAFHGFAINDSDEILFNMSDDFSNFESSLNPCTGYQIFKTFLEMAKIAAYKPVNHSLLIDGIQQEPQNTNNRGLAGITRPNRTLGAVITEQPQNRGSKRPFGPRGVTPTANKSTAPAATSRTVREVKEPAALFDNDEEINGDDLNLDNMD